MKCKYCNEEINIDDFFCPYCGKENVSEQASPVVEETVAVEEAVAAEEAVAVEETVAAEEAPVAQNTEEDQWTQRPNLPKGDVVWQFYENEQAAQQTPAQQLQKPGKQGGKIIVAIIVCVMLIAALVACVLLGGGIDLTPKENDVYCKESYTVEEGKLDKSLDKVVATMGDAKLTNAELQVYYWMEFYDFMQYYGSYLSSLGLDYTQPLSEQYVTDSEMTWEQYFLENALSSWQRYQTLMLMAEDTQFAYPEEVKNYLETITTALETNAKNYGYDSAEAMIQADMGPGGTLEGYNAYMEHCNKGISYFNHLYQNQVPTAAEIEAYFNENAETLETDYGVTKDSGKLIDVRHILVVPQGGTEDENGEVTYSDQEWADCLAEAEGILNEWKTGDATENSFADLANTYSQDTGSNTTGGLYSYVYLGEMVEPFEQWCFDESRQYGDTGIVKTDFGYHIMYFVYGEEGWSRRATEALITDAINQQIAQIQEQTPMKVTYKKIALGSPDFEAAANQQ